MKQLFSENPCPKGQPSFGTTWEDKFLGNHPPQIFDSTCLSSSLLRRTSLPIQDTGRSLCKLHSLPEHEKQYLRFCLLPPQTKICMSCGFDGEGAFSDPKVSVTQALQTRPPGTGVKSADLAQSAFGEVEEVIPDI